MVSNEKGEKQNNKKSFLSVQLMTFSMELGNKKKYKHQQIPREGFNFE